MPGMRFAVKGALELLTEVTKAPKSPRGFDGSRGSAYLAKVVGRQPLRPVSSRVVASKRRPRLLRVKIVNPVPFASVSNFGSSMTVVLATPRT